MRETQERISLGQEETGHCKVRRKDPKTRCELSEKP